MLLPTLFISHGAPTLALEDSPAGQFLDAAASQWPRPAAIVVVSAHYLAAQPSIGAAESPETWHDFSGFPAQLQRLRYLAPGAPDLAEEIADRWRRLGKMPRLDPQRALDHGVWVPLSRLYPNADIPLLPVSVDPRGDARQHFELGQALSDLRRRGILLIGSGGMVHNLGQLDWEARSEHRAPWAAAFADWMRERLLGGDVDQLLRWRQLAPNAVQAHPTAEHLLPLFVALGAAGPTAAAEELHRSTQLGSLALDSYSFS